MGYKRQMGYKEKNKVRKGWRVRVVAVALGMLLACPSVVAVAHPQIVVNVDGKALTFDQPPVIIEDRTLVPMRGIFQALGCSITWAEATQTVTAISGEDIVTLKIGEAGIYKNGVLIYSMPVPARIINERTMVPIRAVSEALGAQVGWDGEAYVVDIFSDGGNGGIQADGYTASIKAADGAEVLHVKVDCPTVSGAQADVINKALSTVAFQIGEGFVQEYEAQAKALYASGGAFEPFYLVATFDTTRDDGTYVSFLMTSTQFTGDDAWVRNCGAYTYARSNGAQLLLNQIITDSVEDMKYFWTVSFDALIRQEPDVFYDGAQDTLLKNLDKIGFYLTEDGIGFFMPPRIISPNETGIVSFTLAYSF